MERRVRVIVELRVLRYFEDNRVLEFQIDWLDRGRRVVYIPNPRRWEVDMPTWARGRRDEILATIKRLTKQHEFIWEEF